MRSEWLILWLGLAACSPALPAPSPDAGDAGAMAAGDAGDGGDGGDGGAPTADGGDAGSDAGSPRLVAGLSVAGDPDEGLGIFDPSIVYPPTADAGFLVYSVVAPDQAHVHTRLATSVDQGATWSFVAEVNQALDGGVATSDPSVCGASTCTGTLIHEVPSLVIDPDDTPARRFKVFTHTYFTDGGAGLDTTLGVLSLYTAPAAAGPWLETRLLGWNSASPFSTTGVSQNASEDAALAGLNHCVALTEPGALLWDTGSGVALDLALECVYANGTQPQIEIDLIRSMDHGQTFASVSTLLSAADALLLGSTAPQIDAPDLFQVGGQTYLFATPAGATAFPGGGQGSGYRGCLGIPLAALDAGQVERAGGAPVVLSAYLGGPEQFVGACTAAEGAPALGVAGDVLALSPPYFGIFATHTAAP